MGDEAACSAALKNFAAAHDVYAQVSFVPVNGRVVCSSTGKHLDLSQSAVFQGIVRAARPSFSVSRDGLMPPAAVLDISHPVLDKDGTYLGYVVVVLPSNKFDVARAPSSVLAALGVVIFDRDGAVLMASGGLESAEAGAPRDRSLVTLAVEHPISFSAASQSGPDREFSVVPVSGGELFVLGIWPAHTTQNVAVFTVPFLAPALIWLASLVAAWLAVEALVNRPVRLLNVAINEFSNGNRMVRAVDVRGASLEIREIAQSFHMMTTAVIRDEAELKDTLHQKEVLLREVHHRVKNNLQIIASIMNMHGRRARTPETRQAIKELQSRVMSLATIHGALYQTEDVGDVNASNLVSAIARQTVTGASGPNRRFDLRQDLADIQMAPDQAVTLALLVGEGLMNVVANACRTGPGLAPLEVRLTRTGPDTATVEIHGSTGDGDRSLPLEMEDSVRFSALLMQVFASKIGGKLEQVVSNGKNAVTVAFRLHPLTDGENRNHPQTDETE
jgi:two-component sensor histidine kinase